MTVRKSFVFLALLTAAAACCMTGGCDSSRKGPQALLDKYFGSAERQDYATTYDCYYGKYREKVGKGEYIRHRKEASVLEQYRVVSITKNGDNAQAVVHLTFSPSEKLHRTKPAEVNVTEDMVRENGAWKIKVW
jgi:hypothetical protein